MKNLGQQIRLFRQQKGISLNSYAQELGVSPGYLSNLETGKTDTIQLSLLDKLQKELMLVPNVSNAETEHYEIELRLQRIKTLLIQLHKRQPDAVEYLLNTIEQGINVFQNKRIRH